MSFPSKFDSKCKDCGIPHKIGDMIEKNNNEHFCKNGKHCIGPQSASETSDTPQTIPTNFTPKLLSPQELIIWNDIIEKNKEYYLVARQNFENDARIEKIGAVYGMITNQSFTQLYAILQKQRDQE